MTNRRLNIGAGISGGGTFANSPLGAPVPEEALEFRWGETPTYVTSTGTWTVPEDYNGYVLVYAIGGGGNGSTAGGGGGGGGGCALSIFKAIPGQVFNVNITSGICTISNSDLLASDMIANKGSNGATVTVVNASGGIASGGNIGNWSGGLGGAVDLLNLNGGGGGGIIAGNGLTSTGGTGGNRPASGGGFAVNNSCNGASQTPTVFSAANFSVMGGIDFIPDSNFYTDVAGVGLGTSLIPQMRSGGGRSAVMDNSNSPYRLGGDGGFFSGGGGGNNSSSAIGGNGGYGGGGGGGKLVAGSGGAAVAVFIISENGKWF